MQQKETRLSIKEKKTRKFLKKGDRAANERDFIELLKRAVQPRTS